MLICFDESPQSRRAILETARLFPGARATVLHVWQPLESTVAYRYSAAGVTGALRDELEEMDGAGARTAGLIAEHGADLARGAGLDGEALAIEAKDELHTAVAEVAERLDARVVVVGSRGLGALSSMALGGFSGPVVHEARQPVLVVPGE